jgi:hypothetical protein
MTETNLPYPSPVIRLAKVLYEEMEFLDPSLGDEVAWDSLPLRKRTFYCLCVARLIRERVDCAAAIENSDNDDVFG